MKKLFLSVAVVAATMLASCGTADNSSTSASDFATKIQNCTNTDSLKTYVEEAKAYAQKLVSEGKLDEAKSYMEKIEPVVKEKAPALLGTFESVKGLLDKVPGKAADAVESAKEAASAAGDSIASAAENIKDAAAEKAEDVKDAAADKANEIKDAAAKKLSDAKDAAAEKVSDAAGNVKDAASDAAKKASDKAKELFDKAK